MTPHVTQQQLYAEIQRVRYGHKPRTLLWQIAASADVSASELYRLASGTASTRTAERASDWLARHRSLAPGPAAPITPKDDS